MGENGNLETGLAVQQNVHVFKGGWYIDQYKQSCSTAMLEVDLHIVIL